MATNVTSTPSSFVQILSLKVFTFCSHKADQNGNQCTGKTSWLPQQREAPTPSSSLTLVTYPHICDTGHICDNGRVLTIMWSLSYFNIYLTCMLSCVTYLVVVVIQIAAYTNTDLRLKQYYVRWKMEANGQNVHICRAL